MLRKKKFIVHQVDGKDQYMLLKKGSFLGEVKHAPENDQSRRFLVL